MNEMLQKALILAMYGLKVFILRPGAKIPATTHGQNDATDDAEQITAWWTAQPDGNIGIACEASGLYVVDVDCGGGKDGQASWDALVQEHGHVDTYTVRTQSGGLHFYYAMPPGEPLRNTAGKLGRHIDTRGNGYVVAPGSIVNGNTYDVVNDAPVADLPQWIVEAVKKRPAKSAPMRTLDATAAPAADVEERVRQLADELATAPDGEGNHTAARIAFMVGGYVGAGQVSATWAQATLENAVSGWTFREAGDERTMHGTIARQLSEGAASPRPWQAARFPERAAESGTIPAVTDDDAPPAAQVAAPSDWSSDAGQARWIVAEARDLIHVKGVGFLKWDGSRWATVTKEQVAQGVMAFYKRKFDEAAQEFLKDPTDPGKMDRCKFLRGRQNASKVSAVVTVLMWLTSLPGSEPAKLLDADPNLLNTPDGVLNLRTGNVLPHDDPRCPGLLITRITSGRYRPGLRHADWTLSSACLPPEVWEYLQLRMGAALVANSCPDTMIFMQGGGRNGKSLLADDGVLPALGDYGHMAPAHVLAGGEGKDGALSPDKAELRGRRFVLIEELEEGSSFSANEAKRLIGTGSLSARTLHEKPMTFDATHTLFATTNHLPSVPEVTDAAWRRLLMVRFEKRFVLDPQEPDDLPADPTLKHRLRSNESGQHDAIVTWLVEGAQRYYADPVSILKDREPALVTEWTDEWRAEADRVMAYTRERVIFDPTCMVSTKDLFDDLNSWLTEGGYTKWSRKTFLDRFLKHDLCRSRVGRSKTTQTSRISRPEVQFVRAPLPTQPEVLTGLRFRTDADDYSAAVA